MTVRWQPQYTALLGDTLTGLHMKNSRRGAIVLRGGGQGNSRREGEQRQGSLVKVSLWVRELVPRAALAGQGPFISGQ